MNTRPRRVKGGWRVWTVDPRTGDRRWVTEYDQRPKPERCNTCHDTGRVITGIADPDDPWSANTYKNCPRGCERKP